ncbi:hypothetical protein [Roseivivax isoporae]|uniref:Uncharacterized protein n=1 Tax=Roseivivax isoporae LMG 25204 TaxID=1449351 RepID=X7F167_9RHOB|nr:hypothetical protein [Roseivivax isoporae]ETX26642.1 hypothetical protein RISW2_21575 [Roseivivax isoporae LMG 25204]
MSAPRFENRWGWSTIAAAIAVAASLAGPVVWYGEISNRVEVVEQDVTQIHTEVRSMDTRVRQNETLGARQDERYSSILGYLARIDTRLERIEQQ